MSDNTKLKASARCAECSEDFTIECTPICQPCFLNKIKCSVLISRKKSLHIDARKLAFQIVILMSVLCAIHHYMGSNAQLVCAGVYILGCVMDSLTQWLAEII